MCYGKVLWQFNDDLNIIILSRGHQTRCQDGVTSERQAREQTTLYQRVRHIFS